MKKTWTEDEIALLAEKAAGMHATGCNCAQSVFLMFAEEGGLDKETARKLLFHDEYPPIAGRYYDPDASDS